jgi:hypothetical protein
MLHVRQKARSCIAEPIAVMQAESGEVRICSYVTNARAPAGFVVDARLDEYEIRAMLIADLCEVAIEIDDCDIELLFEALDVLLLVR